MPTERETARRAVFPGSFDPATSGHLGVARRAADLFDEVVLCVLTNPAKQGRFPLAERVARLSELTSGLTNVRVDASADELLVDYCCRAGITVIVRGLRSATDLRHELVLAQTNRHLDGIETVFLASTPAEGHISSTAISAAGPVPLIR